jgi:hypothetical protein
MLKYTAVNLCAAHVIDCIVPGQLDQSIRVDPLTVLPYLESPY